MPGFNKKDGWKIVQFGDIIAQRRGIWLRITETHAEICGGREVITMKSSNGRR